jgi:hypothetical protein
MSEAEAESDGLIRTVTPVTPTATSFGNKILDAVIGIGAMLLLLPLAPFLFVLWLWDRFVRGDARNDA